MASPLITPDAAKAALALKADMQANGVSCPYQASFLTVARQPEYIHATLHSFLERDPLAALLLPVTLAVGGSDAAYVAPYAEMGIARVIPLTPEEETLMNTRPVPEGKRVHMRFNTNYHRALTVGVDPRKSLLVFEDDVSYTTDWFKKFLNLFAHYQELQGDGFLFSLYSPIDTPCESDIGDIEPPYFYGTQGIYYPVGMRYSCSMHLLWRGIQQYSNPADLLIRNYCWANKKRIFLSRHSLIQHEGMRTTGLSPDPEKCHRSPTFIP